MNFQAFLKQQPSTDHRNKSHNNITGRRSRSPTKRPRGGARSTSSSSSDSSCCSDSYSKDRPKHHHHRRTPSHRNPNKSRRRDVSASSLDRHHRRKKSHHGPTPFERPSNVHCHLCQCDISSWDAVVCGGCWQSNKHDRRDAKNTPQVQKVSERATVVTRKNILGRGHRRERPMVVSKRGQRRLLIIFLIDLGEVTR